MPKKRAPQGDGCIRQRSDGRWEGMLTVGINPATGKQLRKSVYAPTQAECRKKLREATEAVENGTYCEPSKLTVQAWLEVWLSEYLGSVKSSTKASYSQHVRTHIVPAIGAVKLTELKPPMIQKLYNQLQRNGLSPKTIKNLHGCMHRSLEIAEKIGYIGRNPAEACILPRVVEKEIKALDTPEIDTFLKALEGEECEVLFKTALFTGMRSGELLGLTWDCVNFDEGTIFVCKQLLRPRAKGEGYSFGTLKNDKPRMLTPAPSVMRMLKEYRLRQNQTRLTFGSGWHDTNLVFTQHDGGNLTQTGVIKRLQRILEGAGIERRRFHDLRHPYVKLTTKKLSLPANGRTLGFTVVFLHPCTLICKEVA